jgi:hypothetical protein
VTTADVDHHHRSDHQEPIMNHLFDAASIHRTELEREIETLRSERLVAAAAQRRAGPEPPDGPIGRLRLAVGRGLVAAGTALAGRRAGISRLEPEGRSGRSARPA